MKNIEYLFSGILPVNHKKNKDLNKDKIIINKKIFNANGIFSIIEHFQWKLMQNNKVKVKIVVNCPVIGDDATLIVFESLIYYLIKEYDFDIQYTFNVNKSLAGYELYKMSNLFKYDNRKIKKTEFFENYENKFDINLHHFRKICINNKNNNYGIYLSLLTDDICNFLKNNNIKQEYYEVLGEAIIEIIGNCIEHSDADAILDIKVIKSFKNKKECKFLNITIVAFTKDKFGGELKKYLFDFDDGYNSSNEIVKLAYDIQKNKFNKSYSLDNFLMVSSFQKNVTTRKYSEGSGGKGLTFFIETLIESSLADYCYVLNGNTIIFLKNPYLCLNEDGTIGFNNTNNYVEKLPNQQIVINEEKCFNGTIHNLSFILEGEENE
mgnify:FL=1